MSWQRKVPKEDTAPERIVRRMLERLKASFVSQFPLKTPYREWPFIVDFMVDSWLVIEVHGLYWHTKPIRELKDGVKRKCLEAMSLTLLEITDKELKASPELIEEGLAYLLKKGSTNAV